MNATEAIATLPRDAARMLAVESCSLIRRAWRMTCWNRACTF